MTTDQQPDQSAVQSSDTEQRLLELENRVNGWAVSGLAIGDGNKLFGGYGGSFGTSKQFARSDAAGGGVYHDGQWAYDFAVQGGAIGTHTLTAVIGEATIPNGAYLIEATYICTQSFADDGSNTSTVGINIEDASRGPGGDVVAGTAVNVWVSGGLWTAGGGYYAAAGFAQGFFSSHAPPIYIKTTAERTPQIVIGTKAVTVGTFQLFARWVVVS